METLKKHSSEVITSKYRYRKMFPYFENLSERKTKVFLDSAASSLKPKVVIDAIANYYGNSHANVHRGVYQLSQKATDLFEDARRVVANFIGASSESEVIFTSGTTESINLVASSFAEAFLEKDDVILLTEMEHHSNIVPWQLAAKKKGASIEVVKVNDKGELDWQDFLLKIGKKVRLFACNHVSNSLGTINPVEKLIEEAHKHGVLVLVDGAQAMPHLKVDVQKMDADFYAFSAHKMYGPTGFGILYGKKDLLEQLPPYQGGGEMIEKVSFKETTFNELPYKFEAGTPNIAGAIGLRAAIEFMQEIGFEELERVENDLLEYGTNRLFEMDGLSIVGQAKRKTGVISFVLEGMHPYDVGTILDQQGIGLRTGHLCTQPLMECFGIPGTLRASFGIYNTREDVDALADGLGKAIKLLD